MGISDYELLWPDPCKWARNREERKWQAWLGTVMCMGCGKYRRQTIVGLPYAHETCSAECERIWLDALERINARAALAPRAEGGRDAE